MIISSNIIRKIGIQSNSITNFLIFKRMPPVYGSSAAINRFVAIIWPRDGRSLKTMDAQANRRKGPTEITNSGEAMASASVVFTWIKVNISSGDFNWERNPDGLFQVVPPPSAAFSTASSSLDITCEAWNSNAATSFDADPPPTLICQNHRKCDLDYESLGSLSLSTLRKALLRYQALSWSRLTRTSSIFCAILSIVALSFVSVSSAIVAVVVVAQCCRYFVPGSVVIRWNKKFFSYPSPPSKPN